jgi:hypothetical protein
MSTTETAHNGQTDEAKEEAALAVSASAQMSAIELSNVRTFLANRPIARTDLRVIDSIAIPGNRPVFASNLQILDTDTLPGHRPIMASNPSLMNANHLLGNRPIASNDVDDPLTLMGYLD